MRSVLPFLLFSLTVSTILPIIHNAPVLNMATNTCVQLPWGTYELMPMTSDPATNKLTITLSLKPEEEKNCINREIQ